MPFTLPTSSPNAKRRTLKHRIAGTHMYTLYSSYNQPVGLLFGIGFTSSAIFGTFLGLIVDR